MRQEIVLIQSALQRIADLEQKYKLDRDAARAELKLATRALSNIGNHTERIEAVIWAHENTKAPKNDLAWVVFGREHQEFHLRRLVAGPYRNCQKCGERTLAGNRFEHREFYCDPCEATVHAQRSREFNESERRSEARQAATTKRIAELRAQAGLSDADAKELAALMVSQVDGPVSQIADFIFEGRNRQ